MDPALLCETVTGRTMAELTAARDAAAGDMVELRLDGLSDLDVAGALAGRRTPVVVTCRPAWEGGRFEGSEEERRAVLTRALELGADYVDVEWRAGFDELVRAHAERVVLSAHDFEGIPADLAGQVHAMRGSGAGAIKVAVTAARLSDTLPLLPIARDGRAIVVGMGDAGVPTRLLASRYGSRWTYGGHAVAPGQIPARCMLERFRFRDITSSTAIYGVVGERVIDSMSPALHNAAFSAAGIDAVCIPMRAADFEDFLAFADALGVAGVGVAAPFTRDALQAAVSADAPARAGGADTLRRGTVGWEAIKAGPGGESPGIVAQAERQFEWWTGVRPAAGVMRQTAAAYSNTGGARHGVPSSEDHAHHDV